MFDQNSIKKPIEGKKGEYESVKPFVNKHNKQPYIIPKNDGLKEELINKKLDNILKILNKLDVKEDIVINEEVKPKPVPKIGRPKKT